MTVDDFELYWSTLTDFIITLGMTYLLNQSLMYSTDLLIRIMDDCNDFVYGFVDSGFYLSGISMTLNDLYLT